MIAEWSHLALVLALPLVGLQLLLAFLPAAPLGLNEALRARAVRGTAVLGAGLISLSFLGLIASFVAGDFSVKTAFEHSHSAKPLLYKVSGTWGNHEGSILLWVLILSLFGGLLALTGNGSRASEHPEQGVETTSGASALVTHALGVQALVTLAFLAFTIFTSNPFERILPAPTEAC